jgi:hypothetical protein
MKSWIYVFASVEEAATSVDPIKLTQAVETCAAAAIRDSGLGFERGSYVFAMCAAHYANRLARLTRY